MKKKLIWLIAILSSFAFGAEKIPTADDNSRIIGLLQVIDSGNRVEARTYLVNNLSPSFLKIPIEAHLDFISSYHDLIGHIKTYKIQKLTSTKIRILIQSKLTDSWEALLVKIEPKNLRLINAIELAPLPQYMQPANNKLLAIAIDHYLQQLAQANLFSGVIILARNDKPFFEKAYGESNKITHDKNQISTQFNLGSINKMFTAIAIAQLVSSGQISFEDPLAKFLPDFPNPTDAKNIKIKHLLSHTSGLGDFVDDNIPALHKGYTTIDEMMTLARKEKSISFQPGTQFRYSNTGYLVLGKIIEMVTGESYYDYLKKHIFVPSYMTQTNFNDLDHLNTNYAVGYYKQFNDDSFKILNNSSIMLFKGGPEGCGYSTAGDLLKFDSYFRSNKFVNANLTKLLITPKPELHSPNYGYGFMIYPEQGFVGHLAIFLV